MDGHHRQYHIYLDKTIVIDDQRLSRVRIRSRVAACLHDQRTTLNLVPEVVMCLARASCAMLAALDLEPCHDWLCFQTGVTSTVNRYRLHYILSVGKKFPEVSPAREEPLSLISQWRG